MRGDAEAGFKAADRFRQALIDYQGPETLPALSAGVASYPHHGVDKDALLKHADEALFAAKDAGRNQVAVYETTDVITAADTPGSPSQNLTLVRPQKPPRFCRPAAAYASSSSTTSRLFGMLLRTTFEIIDVQVDEAGSAAEAMERLAERTPDVIGWTSPRPTSTGACSAVACGRSPRRPRCRSSSSYRPRRRATKRAGRGGRRVRPQAVQPAGAARDHRAGGGGLPQGRSGGRRTSGRRSSCCCTPRIRAGYWSSSAASA